jgi:hypothetical protein
VHHNALEGVPINPKKTTDLLCVLDNVFLVLSGIYMAFMVYTMSMFQWEVPVIAKIILLGLMLLVAGSRVLLVGLKNRKVWIGAAICIVYGGVFLVSDNSNFLFLAACTIGYLEMDYRKIIRTYLISVGTALFIVVIAALVGWVENIAVEKNGHTRYSVGTIYPTDFASLVLFLLLYLWVALKKIPDCMLLVLPIISFVIAWKVTYSMTSMICSVLFLGVILYHIFDRSILSRHKHLRNVNDWTIALLICVLAGAMILLTILFKSGHKSIQELNELLSHRLYYANRGLRAYGVHPFGSSFEMVGAGISKSSEYVTEQPYNFIDCSYLLILIRYGYLLLLMVLTIWITTVRRFQKADNQRVALAMMIIAIHSVAEHHMIEVHYNIVLALPLADLKDKAKDVLD